MHRSFAVDKKEKKLRVHQHHCLVVDSFSFATVVTTVMLFFLKA